MNNTNKVSNPKVEVPKGIELNDKDYLTSLLTCLKDMEKNYAIVMTEASNKNLYQQYSDVFNQISCMQRKAYELMFQKGWYCLEKAPVNKIGEKEQTLSQEFDDLNV